MIYALYGEDSYRSKAKLEEIKNRFAKVSGSEEGITVINIDEASLEELSLALETRSLFQKKRLLIISNFSKADPVSASFLADRMRGFAREEDVFVFWDSGGPDEKNPLGKELKKHASKSQEFKKLSGTALDRWVCEEASRIGAKLTPQIRRSFLESGVDTRGIVMQLEKMVLELSAEGREGHGAQTAKSNVFALTDAIGSRNKRLALWLLYRFQEEGTVPEKLFWTVLWHLKNLAMVRAYMDAGKDPGFIAKKTKLHPFVVKKGMLQARNFSLSELAGLYGKMSDLDSEAKIFKADMGIGLERIILAL